MFTFFIEDIEFFGKFYNENKIEVILFLFSYDVDLKVIQIDFLIKVIDSMDMQ